MVQSRRQAASRESEPRIEKYTIVVLSRGKRGHFRCRVFGSVGFCIRPFTTGHFSNQGKLDTDFTDSTDFSWIFCVHVSELSRWSSIHEGGKSQKQKESVFIRVDPCPVKKCPVVYPSQTLEVSKSTWGNDFERHIEELGLGSVCGDFQSLEETPGST